MFSMIYEITNLLWRSQVSQMLRIMHMRNNDFQAHILEMRAKIEKVAVARALLFGFTLFSMSFKNFFCNLKFLILTPASEIMLQFFSGTPFRS